MEKEVTKIVEKVVTKEVEKVITATPVPKPEGPTRGGTAIFTIGSEPETLNPYLTSAGISWPKSTRADTCEKYGSRN